MRNRYTAQESRSVAPLQGPQLVRWGSVFSGTLIAIALFALLTGLWLALSFSSHVSFVYTNLSWWIGGTAIFCMFIAGLIAGVTSGARGVGAGSMGGLTTWALILIGVGMFVLPTFGIGHIPNRITASGHVYSINYLTYWTAFCSMVIGLGASLLGGMIGGGMQRSVDNQYLDLQRVESSTTGTVPVAATVPVAVGDGTTAAPVYQRQV